MRYVKFFAEEKGFAGRVGAMAKHIEAIEALREMLSELNAEASKRAGQLNGWGASAAMASVRQRFSCWQNVRGRRSLHGAFHSASRPRASGGELRLSSLLIFICNLTSKRDPDMNRWIPLAVAAVLLGIAAAPTVARGPGA
jgi:hypothetical protein